MFSLVEILIASLILAMSATATAYWVETVANLAADADEQTVAASIAKITEGVLAPKKFRETGSTNFGAETGETLHDYDDLDDFDGLVTSPPLDADLNPMTQYPDWSVTVKVDNYSFGSGGATKLSGKTSSNVDMRGVTVSVTHRQKEIAHAFWLRARSPLE